MSSLIPLSVPEIRGNEWLYIKECLDAGWVSSAGVYVEKFEAMVASAVGRRHAVAVCNGTSALHIALLVAGVSAGDEVLVSDLTFIAPVNAVTYASAHPVLVDAEPEFWQMNIDLVENFLRRCRRSGAEILNADTGRRIAAILPVHALGSPVNIERLCALAAEFGIPVIEDATESLGAMFQGKAVGSHGTCACFSFNGNKILTTGGGGMVVTDDDELAARAKYLSTQAKDNSVEYVHKSIGYNYRLTNIQAAMGCAQMERLVDYVEAKRLIAKRYEQAFAGLAGVDVMKEPAFARSSFWMYTILLDREVLHLGSRDLLARLSAENIQSRPLWEPMHLSLPHRNAQYLGDGVSEKLYRDALSLPCSVGLPEQDQERVIAAVKGGLT